MRVIEIAWQYDPHAEAASARPATAEEELFALQRGNRVFADLGRTGGDRRYVIPVSAGELGFGDERGRGPQQTPAAALLGCADARVPLELVFAQPANDLFTVRVAGNVLDGACVGSLDFAVNQLPTVRVLAVVGHTSCGAVRGAVDAYLEPAKYLGLSANLALRGIIDMLMPVVRGADNALRDRYGHERAEHPGYYEALVDTAVVLNAAVSADAVRRMFATRLGPELGVAFGVYDLASRLVGLPHATSSWRHGLFPPPEESQTLAFVQDIVDSQHVQGLLAGF